MTKAKSETTSDARSETAGGLRVVRTIAELRGLLAERRAVGASVALVPTMGALHDGHLALARRAREVADVAVVSIFVNPLQFGAGEDLDRYPRTFDADIAALDALGAQFVFAPSVEEMYPDGPSSTRVAAGEVASLYEGASRPGHFDGMLTVVSKLFHIVMPDVAVFGQKDAQQVFLVKRMVSDLDMPLSIDVVTTVREDDGLAMSSRNRYLDETERKTALVLSEALRAAADAASEGVDEALAEATAAFGDHDGVELDYLVIVDPETFLPVAADATGPAVALVAARVGTTRLIDNRPITLG
ncbi:pantoate--beta-alanine ligase [Agromyces protaetiae]|uniref:Pantothenate synthetase n=1 Tax=Agromyces protaetiae TaxID=2509455 RepID=A0A4P6FRC8_9MICO|nr:pantoate--beta-alanine ligase [Agromyces protaetiae]QAY73088.1 pantoate--beta-alanine ligase [Agromyces protaetiae]